MYQNYGQVSDRECGPCPGNGTQYCGGVARNSVYKLAGMVGRYIRTIYRNISHLTSGLSTMKFLRNC